MHVLARTPTSKNPPERFTGDVWLDPIASPREEGQRITVAKVRFAPGARTAWHSHARGQTLHVTQGVAWMQSRGAESGDRVERSWESEERGQLVDGLTDLHRLDADIEGRPRVRRQLRQALQAGQHRDGDQLGGLVVEYASAEGCPRR